MTNGVITLSASQLKLTIRVNWLKILKNLKTVHFMGSNEKNALQSK